jgi:hypothetical protein
MTESFVGTRVFDLLLMCFQLRVRFEVSATMTGLVEYAGPNKGFGHRNRFPMQSLETTSVKDLSCRYKTRDFSTTPIRFPTGYVRGGLRDADGKPVDEADLTVYSATDPNAHIEDDSATTDEMGRFRFALPPGKYVIGFRLPRSSVMARPANSSTPRTRLEE